MLTDFVGEAVGKLGEGFMIKNSPDDSVVEGQVVSPGLGEAVIAMPIGHVEKVQIGEDADEKRVGAALGCGRKVVG